MAKNVLIAWELGGGLGHLVRAAALARAFAQEGFAVTAVLRDLADCSRVQWPDDVRILQAPICLSAPKNFSKPASYAELVYASGYHDPSLLDGLTNGWVNVMELLDPVVMVADHAPTAILAAKLMDIPCVRVGTGFFSPPVLAPYPPFRTWEPIDLQRCESVEKFVLSAVNAVVQGDIAFDTLAQALHPDLDLIASWPELDHYAATRPPGAAEFIGNETAVNSGGQAIHWKHTHAQRLLVYLKRDYPALSPVLEALQQLDCEVVVYVAGATPDTLKQLNAPHITVVTQLIDMESLFKEDCSLLCHAGSGTVALALEHEVPVFLLPMTVEQFVYAKQVEKHHFGVLLNDAEASQRILPELRKFLNTSSFKTSIRAAKKCNQDQPSNTIAHVVQRCVDLIS